MTAGDWTLYLAAALLPPLAIALAAGGLIRALAPRLGQVDRPGERKIHAVAMPTSGGVAIWLAMVLPLAAGQLALAGDAAWAPDFFRPHLEGLALRLPRVWQVIGGGTVLLLLGLWDDRRGLDWRIRLAVQTAVAAAMVALGWRMTLFVDAPWLTGAISVLWIVGLVNSFNMLDNMDGLSAGVAAIAAGLLAATLLAGQSGGPQLYVGGFLLLLVGALVGFLWHNRPPARLFMGDAGSYLIGFLLATTALAATFARPPLPRHAVLTPLCVLAVPLYDTATVVLLRLRSGRSPFVGDKSHFSHRLVALGLSRAQAVLTIYLVTAACGLHAVVLPRVDAVGAAVVLLSVALLLAIVAVLEAAGRRGPPGRLE